MMAFFFTIPMSKNDANQSDDSQIVAGQQQSQNRAHTGGRQRRKDGDGMDVAFIKHAQHDIHRDDRGQNQQRLG